MLFRWVRKKIGVLLLLVALTVMLKQAYPAVAERVGGWISGMGDSRVAQAVSSMISTLSDGEGIREAVEVFREEMQP
ncbi:MAG: hypothetical protein ACI3VU_03425 [Faecousia sp.]|nr:hypothetical protein [Bacillota bacterium]